MTTIDFKDLPDALHQVADQVIPALALAMSGEGLRIAFREVVRRSPVDSRRYQASHIPSAGKPAFAKLGPGQFFPVPGDDRVDSALKAAKPGDPLFLTNDATSPGSSQSYAPVLEAGLHINSRGARAGSPQAPEGVYSQVVGLVPAELEQQAGAVIARVLGDFDLG